VYWITARSVAAGDRAGDLRGDGGARRAGPRDGEAQEEARAPGHGARHVDGHDALGPHGVGQRLDRRDRPVPRDHGAGAVVLELVLQLARRVERVVLDDHGAEAQHGVERDDVLGAVREHDRDRVARADARVVQALRGARDPLAELAVAGLRSEEVERGAAGEPEDGLVDDVHERSLRQVDLVRDVGRVAGQPGPLGGGGHPSHPRPRAGPGR
jgi:hypothetical protein